METQREIRFKDDCGFKLKFLAKCNVCKEGKYEDAVASLKKPLS